MRVYGYFDRLTKPHVRLIMAVAFKEVPTVRRMAMTENMTPIDRKCIEQSLTRKELSIRSGVPLRTLEAWAKRARIPRDVYQLHKVAQALGCRIEDIIEPDIADGGGSDD